MDTSNTNGVFSPPDSKTHPQFICFIDSGYNELFKIPDGSNIKVIYPHGDNRGESVRVCHYIDDHHFRINSEAYHICEFAERMERIGARYEPEIQLRGVEIVPYSPGEEKYCTYNREEGNTCIGHISGEFGQSGNRFFSGWYNHTTRSEGDWTDTTPEFQAELQSAVYALRQDLLKNHDSMLTFCQSRPEAKLPDSDDHEHYGFKLETESRQYFIRCFAAATNHESRFIIYAYADKPAREQERTPVMEVLPGKDIDRSMFYQSNKDSLSVGYMRGDFGKGGGEFWHNWFDGGEGKNTPEFKAELQTVVELLRQDILKDLRSSQNYCYQHPEAQLLGDVHRYGFKLETESRNYFVRCTVLPNDYFYVFAYDKAAPVLEQEKPSVLKQIRDAENTPKPPRKSRALNKKKDGTEL